MLFAATWIDLDIIILSKSNKYHMISFLCEIIKILQMDLFTKQKQTHRHRKQTYSLENKFMVTTEERKRGSGG